MGFPIIVFCLSWISFLMFADKRKFHSFTPTCYLALILALVTDLLMFVYPLWEYTSNSAMQLFLKQMINSFGIYFVVTYFYLQTLPEGASFSHVILHTLYWSVGCIAFEALALKVGYIKHGLWWNLAWSFLADLMLFLLFFSHHKWLLRRG